MKKSIKKVGVLALTLCLLAGTFAVAPSAASKIKFKKNAITIKIAQTKNVEVTNPSGKTIQLMNKYNDNEGFNCKVVSPTSIQVTGKQVGTYELYIKSTKKKVDSIRVVILPKKVDSARTIKTNTFKLKLPKAFKKNTYVVLKNKKSVTLYSKKNMVAGFGGTVATFETCTKKEWKTLKKDLPNYTYICKKGSNVFYMTLPTDVQHSSDKKLLKAYNKLANAVKDIKLTAK